MMYTPVSAVWEITRKCTMSCKHCGHGCVSALPDELTTDEAVALCAAIGDLGVERVYLSGGEPTTRSDWHVIARQLHKAGVSVSLATNGWAFDQDAITKAIDARVDTVMLSIDGLERTHDFLRQPGSFLRSMRVLDALRQTPVNCMVVTTITTMNLGELPDLLKVLEEKNVSAWKLQPAFSLCGSNGRREIMIQPGSIDSIISTAQTMSMKSGVDVQLDHCIGYYHGGPTLMSKSGCDENAIEWQGCGAGKSTLGILHNGDIVGCTRIRDKKFVEGSIRKKTLAQLWHSPASFLWNKNIKKERLAGFCARCQYGHRCRGGCAAARLSVSGDIFGENKYCSYNQAFSRVALSTDQSSDIEELLHRSIQYIEQERYQLAEVLLWRGLSMDHDNPELLQLYRFVNFMVNPDETDYMNSQENAKAPVSA